MTRTEEILKRMSDDPSTITNAQFVELQQQLEEDARLGNPQAMSALFALNFKTMLAREYVRITRTMLGEYGTPNDLSLVVAGALVDSIEEMVQGPIPDLYETLDEMIRFTTKDPQVLVERAQQQANFRARMDLAERLQDEGASNDTVKAKVRELYLAQLQDVMDMQDNAEERIAS